MEVLGPCFERSSVGNSQRKVIEADCTLVECVGGPVRVLHETDAQKTWVVHIPHLEARLLPVVNTPEAHDLFPPANTALSVSDRQVDVAEAVDRREARRNRLRRCHGVLCSMWEPTSTVMLVRPNITPPFCPRP